MSTTTEPATERLMACVECRTNAELIELVQPLYLPKEAKTLDCTYGNGTWWKRWRPDHLTVHDLGLDGVDFRNSPHPDASFDRIIFDPPYLPQGGRETSTTQDFLGRFGLHGAPTTSEELRALISDGLAENWRLLRKKGLLLLKAMNYVSGAKHRPQVHWALIDAERIGYRIETQIVHLSGTGPQPTHDKRVDPATGEQILVPRRVLSPRANYSVLLILRKPSNARPTAPALFTP